MEEDSSEESIYDDEASEEGNGSPEEFDIENVAEHGYLFRFQDTETATVEEVHPLWMSPGTSADIPLIYQLAVILPGQSLPIFSSLSTDVNAVNYAVKNGTYLAVLPHNGVVAPTEYGTLVQIQKHCYHNGTVNISTIGRQRFHVERTFEQALDDGTVVKMVNVEVVDDGATPSPFVNAAPRLMRLNREKQFKKGAELFHFSANAFKQCSIDSLCDKIAHWMCSFASQEKISAERKKGVVHFCDWIVSNTPFPLDVKYEYLAERNADCRVIRLYNALRKSMNAQLICVCRTVVGKFKDNMSMSTEGTTTHYVNPGGYVHEMITLSDAVRSSFILVGLPSSQFSWFEGYKWQIIECANCMRHLGWEFTSSKFKPSSFIGFSKNSVRIKEDGEPDFQLESLEL